MKAATWRLTADFASAPLLALVYALRVLAIAAFVASPQGGAALLGFAVAIGLTSMAALPPTAELLARSFGVERLSGLLGATMLIRQVGAFFGAWLGGVAVERKRRLPAALARRRCARGGRRCAADRAHAGAPIASSSAERSASGSMGLRSSARTPERLSSAASMPSPKPL